MKPEKQLLLNEIKGKIDLAPSFILTSYQKMDPNLAAKFRKGVFETGGDFEVVRKRVFVKAAAAAGITLDADQLKGHVGIVFAAADPIQTTKAVFKFRQDNEEVLEILGGRFEDALYSAKDVESLSKLPGKKEMQAQFLGLLEAVPAQTLSVFEALLTSLGYCLDNKSKT